MTHFLLSSLCLLAFWLFYKLALENISWHRFKRLYLLAVIVIAVVIPFIVVKVNYVEIQQQMFMPYEVAASPVTDQSVATNQVAVPKSTYDWTSLLWLLYGLGSTIMAVRFGRNVSQLRIRSTDEVSRLKKYILVRKEQLTVPCSFLNRIYIPKNKEVPNHILNHEIAHLDQRHSWDIIFIEVLLILFWFHPVLYLMKYSIKLNHEFLADQEVLTTGYPLSTYQKSLLEFMQYDASKRLVHTYNFPIIKKRFTIMSTKTNIYNGLLRSFAIIPILVLLIISCGKEKEEIVIPESQTSIVIDNNSPSGTVLIDGTSYQYTNDESGIKILDQNGDPINYYAKGWDIRERLIRPNDDDFDNLTELYTGLKKGSKIFVDDVEITEAEFRKVMHHKSDSLRVEQKNGFNYFYLYNLTAPKVKYKLSSNDQLKDLNVIKTTQEVLDQQQKNPVATAMMHAMKLKHGDQAVYYLEGLEVLPSTITLAASYDLKLGFKVSKDDQGRPSLYAAKGLPHTTDDLQHYYDGLLEGIDLKKQSLIYYDTPVNITKKQPQSGYGLSLDSIRFKSK